MITIKNIFQVLIISLLIISISSCNSNVVFEENEKLPDNRWEEKNKISFDVEIADTVALHNIYINLRNASGYQFRNIFLFLTTTIPSGKKERDTLEMILADENGKWLGDGMGDIWDNRQLFKSNFRFPETGTYNFQLEQAMRFDPLPQIMDAGIRIERAGE